MKRRSLIKSIAAAALGAPMISFNKPKSGKNLSLKKIKHNPIGVSTYSFWQFNGRETPIEYCIDKASEFGFDGIELLLIQMESEENSYLQKLKKRAFDSGLDIMGLSTHQSYVSPDASKRKENIEQEKFAEFADEEARKAITLFKEEFIRELYSIKGGKGACMIVEASSEEEILIKLSDLPFVKNNYLDIDIIEVKPYRGFV